MILCNTCGNPLDVGKSLCATCGAQAPYDPETTQRIPPPHTSNVPGGVLPSPRSEVVGSNRNPIASYIIIALLALIAGGGIVAVLRSGVKDNSGAEPLASNSSNALNIPSITPVSTPKPQSETEAKPAPSDSGSTSSPTRQLPQAASGSWFVILGSFPKNDYEKAKQRLQNVQGFGYDASIIDTDNYPGLSGGLWVVVMGPYSKSYAKSVAAKMKSARSDAYIKSGW